jgi:gliding motility-associated-like protein
MPKIFAATTFFRILSFLIISSWYIQQMNYGFLKRVTVILLFVSFFCKDGLANHTKGGYMYYQYLGPGSSPNKLRYAITLKLYTNCLLNNNQFNPTINFSIFGAASNDLISNDAVSFMDSADVQNCVLQACHPCISPIPSICYKITTYQLIKELDRSSSGYIIAYQRCCRIAGINNIQPPSNNIGETWTVTIPGTATAIGAERNTSATFALNDTAIICEGGFFNFDFSARDINNDSLVYEFCDAFIGGASGNANPSPAAAPPYIPVSYASGYSGAFPMGNAVTINRTTGIVSGIAPTSGVYVLTVCVSEYKRGTNTKISEVRKSLHIQVANCQLTQAKLNPEYVSCDGFTLTFSNNATSTNIQSWFWDFGVPGVTTDTSDQQNPTFTYPDTGVYVLKFVVNRGLNCSDSTTAIVKVYPGFFPDFTIAGQCKNTPIQFRDATTTVYGTVNNWSWDFGDPGTLADTSHQQFTAYTYGNSGTYLVRFVVGNSKGCIDTVYKPVNVVDRALFEVSNDTLICVIDTIQLSAAGAGTFLWSPNYNISSLTSPTPLISPDVPTTYYITFTDAFGCQGNDSVRVNVKSFVTLEAGNDTTICRTDSIVLRPFSDGLYYAWTPTGSLSNATIKNPVAKPLVTTTYFVTSSIGKCISNDFLTVSVVPYPVVTASNDTTICFKGSAQLQASGGSSYAWLPAAYLNNNFIANPFASGLPASIRYVVYVRDTLGCPKPATDTVWVRVYPEVIADAGPRDTSIVEGEPLLLRATGGDNYLWSPPTYLSNAGTSRPVAVPPGNIEYVVNVSNDAGCFDTDTILVKVFFVQPGFYIPNSFTPNGDGKNDLFRPILLGMKSLNRFAVYNRWGQLLFSTTAVGHGWNGTFAGKPQDAATFTWYVEGVDYKNRLIKQKGTVILLR